MPKRGKRRRRKKYLTAEIDSEKGGRFTTRSSYETRYAAALDADPTVLSYAYESIAIKYRYKNRNRNYIPDFVVTFTDGSQQIHEVKPQRMLKKTQNRAKFAAARRGELPFVLITEDDLPPMGQ